LGRLDQVRIEIVLVKQFYYQ